MITDFVGWGGLAMLVGGLIVIGISLIASAYSSAVGGLAISAFGLMMFLGSVAVAEEEGVGTKGVAEVD